MKTLILIIIFAVSCVAQSKNSITITDPIERFKKQNNFLKECEEQTGETQLLRFGKILPKIIGECEWSINGCPISLVKPYFPILVQKLQIFGKVKIEILVNEAGRVVYLKHMEGNNILSHYAEEAAGNSRFSPAFACGKPMMQKRIIIYNFNKQ